MKTFILGVGAQKCGTTWLYDQCKANKMVNTRFRKEYHILDSIENPKQHNRFREKYIQNALDLHEKVRLGINLSNKIRGYAKHSLTLSFIDNVENTLIISTTFTSKMIKLKLLEISLRITPN